MSKEIRRGQTIIKRQKITDVGKDVERRKPLNTAGENVN